MRNREKEEERGKRMKRRKARRTGSRDFHDAKSRELWKSFALENRAARPFLKSPTFLRLIFSCNFYETAARYFTPILSTAIGTNKKRYNKRETYV